MDFISQFGIDLLFLIILVISILDSIRRGFLKSVLSLACVILAFIVASVLNEPVAQWCYDSFLSDSIVEKIEDNIPETEVEFDVESIADYVPEFLIDRNEEFDIDDIFDEAEKDGLSTHEIAETISDKIIGPPVIMILRLICYLIIFLLVRFLLSIVSRIISKLDKLPVIKQFNKTLGGLLGFVKGLFIVIALAVALNFIAEVLNNSDNDNMITETIENSFICDIINDIK